VSSGEDDAPVDVVLSVGALDVAVVALREFLHRVGALEIQAVLDREVPAMITVGRNQPVEVLEGERLVHLPHAVALAPEPPPFPGLRQLPPLEVDVAEGTVAAPFGGVRMLADALTGLAGALGGRTVVLAFLPALGTEDPVGIAARAGEEPIVTVGEDQFRLPAG